jgi:hypothetical protein
MSGLLIHFKENISFGRKVIELSKAGLLSRNIKEIEDTILRMKIFQI